MRRTSRIYLNLVNPGKILQIKDSIITYTQAVNFFIELFWSEKDLSSNLADKTITDKAVERFNITARLAQCAAKQAKEIVRSQRKLSKNKQRMPVLKNRTINLDSRFVSIEIFTGHFELCLKLSSGMPKIILPFNLTEHANKFLKDGWTLSNSIRLGLDGGRLFIDLIFEKPRPEPRKQGKTIGIDRGFNKILACSDGQIIGQELKEVIKSQDKRSKSSHHFIETEVFRHLKSLDLTGVKEIVLEDLNHIKHGKRGKFSRNMNRLLSFWLTARVVEWLRQKCEETGIQVRFVSPSYTSQRCSHCGKIDKRNRRGERFKCKHCGYEDDSDINASKNLEYLGLAGAYSLRLLKTKEVERFPLKEDFSIF